MSQTYWEDIEVPVTNAYMKFEKGLNRFRVVSQPIVGMLYWMDKKPIRVRKGEMIPVENYDPEQPPKNFWAFVVWNYEAEAINILEITQKSVMKAIALVAKDSDWGTPTEYDLVVGKEGEGKETRYSVTPKPKKALDKEIKTLVDATKVNLEALFDSQDPFAAENQVVGADEIGSDITL